jgi:hypothetical protein
MDIHLESLLWLPLQKFVSPQCCYYRLQEIANYDVGAASNGIIFMPNFVDIDCLVLNLETEHSDTRKGIRCTGSVVM